MVLNIGGQTIVAKEVQKVATNNVFQEINRISSLLEIELFKWVKETSFKESLPQWEFSWEDVEKDIVYLKLKCNTTVSPELFLLFSKPEVWKERAEEWVLRNTHWDLRAAHILIGMVKLSLMKRILKEKVGYSEFDLIEDRLNKVVFQNPFRNKTFLDKKEPLDQWYEDLQYFLEIYSEECKRIYRK